MFNAIPPYALNSVLTQGSQGVQGSLVGAADLRQFGSLDTADVQGSPDTMSFISVVLQPNPQ